jgi:hypothetical protein
MNIKTQKLLDQLYELKRKLLLYINQNESNMYIDQYITDLNTLEAYFFQAGCYQTNAPLSNETYAEIQYMLDNIQNITSVLF